MIPVLATNLGLGEQDSRSPELPFTFESEQNVFRTMLKNYGGECDKVRARRELRKHRVNVMERRRNKEILDDETIIPDRTVDTSTRGEKKPYIKYIEGSSTVLSFEDTNWPDVLFTDLDNWTTQLFRYRGWKIPFFYTIDALLVHGGNAVELMPDPAAPGKCVVEYIRREHLLIPEKTRKISTCARIGRIYETTKQQFKEFAQKVGFNPAVVAQVLELHKDRDDFVKFYKWYAKDDSGTVFIMWFADELVAATSFLKDPLPHDIGLCEPVVDPLTQTVIDTRPLPVKVYTIFFYPYHAEEDETLLEVQGRAGLDQHVQEAQTAVLSATVNGAVRASRFFPTREPTDPGATPSNDTLFVLKHGAVYEGKYSVFQPNWPNAIALSIMQSLGVRKAQETGQVDFAAMNRQDTAKTATELNAAMREAEDLSSINISLFSAVSLDLYGLWWEVIKSQVKCGFILPPPNVAPLMQLALAPNSTLVYTMAADAQVVKRAQRVAQYIQHYALVVGTEYQRPFFLDMMRNLFPSQFTRWTQEAQQYRQELNFLNGSLEILSQMPLESAPPESRPKIVNFLNQLDLFLHPEKNERKSNAGPTA